VFDD